MTKKNAKNSKGITLIALVITIIILMILATVSIQLVKNSGIIRHAETATSKYVIEEEKERIALAYSQYKMEKFANPNISELKIEGEKVTSEKVGTYGWKVKYEDTGNVYGVNTKGEYDEAVTMIIEASEATGLGLDCFIIYEDQYAINANKTAGSITMPERYVFYNWNKLTLEQIETIETTYIPKQSSTEKICNASNRLFNLDANGDGKFDYSDCQMVLAVTTMSGRATMKSDKHDKLAEICIKNGTNKSVLDEIVETFGDFILWDGTDADEDTTNSYGINFLLNFEEDDAAYYVNGSDSTIMEELYNQIMNFNEMYKKHIYYNSDRPQS